MAAPLPRNGWQETQAKLEFTKEPWMVDGACRNHPGATEIFFSDRDHAHKNIKAAREICSKCPVWKLCLRFALEQNEEYGMWGGLTPKERDRVRHSSSVRKCSKCKLIRLNYDKAETVCDPCRGISFPKRKRLG